MHSANNINFTTNLHKISITGYVPTAYKVLLESPSVTTCHFCSLTLLILLASFGFSADLVLTVG
jgi:hypothetical protein